MLKTVLDNGVEQFSINNQKNRWGHTVKSYKSVIKLNADIDIIKLQHDIDNLSNLHASILGKSINTGLIPTILSDQNINKIHVHVNEAFSSKAYRIGKIVYGKVIPTNRFEKSDVAEAKEITYKALKELNKLGYLGKEPIDSDYVDIMRVYVDAEAVCRLFGCDYIQGRVRTGVQVKGDYFSLDEEGFLGRAKLNKIGILLIPNDFDVEVMKSLRRKKRSDALQKTKEGLINIPLIDGVEIFATLYQRFDK